MRLKPQNIVAAAIAFELALGLGGALLARACGENLQQLLRPSIESALRGVAAAAGIGEESLFRGALQPIVIAWTSPIAGLIIVSLVFGLLHAASSAYFLLATAVGAYLGWMTLAFNDLTAPILCHAIYDFVALLWLQRRVE